MPGGDPRGQGAAAGPQGRVVRVLGPGRGGRRRRTRQRFGPEYTDLFRDDRMVHKIFPEARNLPELCGGGRATMRPGITGRTGNTAPSPAWRDATHDR